ncbi:hypothetical protein ACVWWJ_002627 [Luteibacter sp. HA06]
MGFYLRKSINVGPLRFNLSGSGVGVSVGVPGFRIGAGPRGNYVQMSHAGLTYRSTLGPRQHASVRPGTTRPPRTREPVIPDGTHGALEDIESAETSTIVDSSSADLLEEIRAKRARLGWAPIVFALGGVALWWAIRQLPTWAAGMLAVLLVIAAAAAHLRDVMVKTVVLFYAFDDPMERGYAGMHAAARGMAAAAAAWHIEARGDVYNRKYHAGASNLVTRKRTSISMGSPPGIKTNVETVSVQVGRQTLHFLPDRVLVYEGLQVGAVSYRALRATASDARFIESESVPHDATVVGHTWRFVNKNGGPDRRFSNNRQIPICNYEEIRLSSHTGLNELVQLSRAGAGESFCKSVAWLGQCLPAETA